LNEFDICKEALPFIASLATLFKSIFFATALVLPLHEPASTMKRILLAFITSMSLLKCDAYKTSPPIEIVRFNNKRVSLEGVLHLPEGLQKYPLAIFIHGSGRTTRNDYEELVAPLLRANIAVFRYDKRGVGASEGVYEGVDPGNSTRVFSLLASDAAAAVQHFKNDKRIAADKIILIGGSQAGWIIPEINAISNAWLSICISGPTVSVGEEIFYSDLAENGLHSQQYADKTLKDFNGVHGYSPISNIRKMKSPSLWIFGGKDVSIPVKKSMQLLDSIKILRQLPIETKLYPNANHGLYNSERQRHEDYVNLIVEWIRRHR
jgi:dipeptidyl aminopeptidase/acylaminoacyl peptidase